MKAHLEGPNLTDARLGGADLTMSMLRKANLEGSDLSRARLENAGLTALYLAITVLFERRTRLVQLRHQDVGANAARVWTSMM